ncbi:MAG TPA: hypothetical protein VET23_11480 [Chitinophagaceae bacterium]|nr:hypothetical protein [Chitinophagaceae bacterium]
MEENQSVFDLQVDETASRNLSGAAGWAQFMAIFAFVFMGIILLAIFAFRNQILAGISSFIPGLESSQMFGFITATVIFAVIICAILMILLLRGAILIRRGIQTKNQITFNSGLGSLKSYFTMIGILYIILIFLNLIGLLNK